MTDGGYWLRIDGETVWCAAGWNALTALERAGNRAVPIGCRRGGCGRCKVRVLTGAYTLTEMSGAFISEAEQRRGVVLACCLWPTGDMDLSRNYG